MGSSFYNTISFDGDELKEENAKAMKQEMLVLALFKANPGRKLSPSQIHKVFGRKYHLYPPIQSIRRSITNLSNPKVYQNKNGAAWLVKTPEMTDGPYGLPEHLWRLNYEPDPFVPKPISKPFFGQGDLFS